MHLPDVLSNCYNLSDFDSRLNNILLSKYGIFQDRQGIVPAVIGANNGDPLYGCFCNDCLPVIMKDISKKKIYLNRRRKTNEVDPAESDNSIDEDSAIDDDEDSTAHKADLFGVAADEQPMYEYTDHPPMYAIANGNFIGHLPERFQDLSRSEEAAVALMVVCIYLSTIVSSHMTVINSHHYIIKNPDPVIQNVPASTTGTVRVAMVGAFTEEKEAKVS